MVVAPVTVTVLGAVPVGVQETVKVPVPVTFDVKINSKEEA